MTTKCPKTISGKHLWEFFAVHGQNPIEGLIEGGLTKKCIACGLIDDIKVGKNKDLLK